MSIMHYIYIYSGIYMYVLQFCVECENAAVICIHKYICSHIFDSCVGYVSRASCRIKTYILALIYIYIYET